MFTSYCSEQSACTALWHFRQNIVATINVFFVYFCPKKGCPKFCMRPWIRKDYTLLEYFNNPKLKQRDSTKIWYFFEIVIHFWKYWGSLPFLKNLGPLPFLKRWGCLPLKKNLGLLHLTRPRIIYKQISEILFRKAWLIISIDITIFGF